MSLSTVAYNSGATQFSLNKKNVQPSPQRQSNNTPQNVSFEGNLLSTAGDLGLKALSTIESKPVLALAVIDFLGMILPRIIIDTNRNKEELGHLNWDAGRETAMREVFSSFVLFFMPGVLFTKMGDALLNSKFNKLGVNTASHTNFKTLELIKNATQDVLKKSGDKVNVKELREAVARTLLEGVQSANPATSSEIAKNAGRQLSDNKNILLKGSEFVDDVVRFVGKQTNEVLIDPVIEGLAQGRKSVAKVFGKLFNKEFVKEMASVNHGKVAEMAPKISDYLQETEAVLNYGGKSVGGSVETIVRDILGATDDVVAKAASLSFDDAAKAAGQNADEFYQAIPKEKLIENVDKVAKSMKHLKYAKLAIPFAVTTGLLVTFPKFSAWLSKQLHGGKDVFPGMTGLDENCDCLPPDTNNTIANNNNSPGSAPSSAAIPPEPKSDDIYKSVQSALSKSGSVFAQFEGRNS